MIYTVLDIETTGFSYARGDKIIEIGAVKINENGDIIEEFSSLINPNKFISQKIQQITGITNEMVKDSPIIDDVMPNFKTFIKDTMVVAHNANFDCKFLNFYGKRCGLHIRDSRIIDTLKISRKLHSNLTKHKLSNLCNYFDIPYESGHRALSDAIMTARIFAEMLKNELYAPEINKGDYADKQISLDMIANSQAQDLKGEKKKKEKEEIQIKSISYWEAPNQKLKRLYVNTTKGDMFLDIIRLKWIFLKNAKFSHNDVPALEEQMLKLLNLEHRNELLSFKGKCKIT